MDIWQVAFHEGVPGLLSGGQASLSWPTWETIGQLMSSSLYGKKAPQPVFFSIRGPEEGFGKHIILCFYIYI